MTPTPRSPPKTLVVLPYLHRNSQCSSCLTVLPGDICFNCGRLSTLLVTPRPPRNSMASRPSTRTSQSSSSPTQSRPKVHIKPFVSQIEQVEHHLQATKKKNNTVEQCSAQRRAFDSQHSEIDNLQDAGRNLAPVHTLAANDTTLLDDRFSKGSFACFNRCQRAFPSSSTAYSTRLSGSGGGTLRSDDDRPYVHAVERWLDEVEEPCRRTEAKSSARGVDCSISMPGKVCEWVIWL